MYVTPASIAEATARFWIYLRDGLRAEGMRDVPDALDTSIPYAAAWTHPHLLLAQTCGYPYVRDLRGRVRLVATPCYAHEGCTGSSNSSLVVVRADSAYETLEDLCGAAVAINEPDSNSGVNLFRAAIAPLAEGRPFFSKVIETGDHLVSMEAVRSGTADVAAIDPVTFGHTARFAPESAADLRILAKTPSGPGLPFITALGTPDAERDLLRQVLDRFATDPVTEEIRDTLALTGFAHLDDPDYERLAELEREAARLGYPELA